MPAIPLTDTPHRAPLRSSGTSPTARAVLTAWFAFALVFLWPAPSAGADPIGPTDYQSDIVSVTPSASAATFEILGGDAFLRLTLAPGHSAEIPGYSEEPYLRFESDGRVLENRNSPTYHLNESRYGTDHDHDNEATDPPKWVEVAGDGTYAWHDHRIHYMGNEAPPGTSPGDVILTSKVNLLLDESPTEIKVRSRWLATPSPLPAILGALLGAALIASTAVVAAWRIRSAAILGCAAITTVLTAAQMVTNPPGIGGSWTLWVLPLAALLGLSFTLLRARVPARTSEVGPNEPRAVSNGLLAASAVLLVWTYIHRGAAFAAISGFPVSGALIRAVVAFQGAAVAAATIIEAARLWAVPNPTEPPDDGAQSAGPQGVAPVTYGT